MFVLVRLCEGLNPPDLMRACDVGYAAPWFAMRRGVLGYSILLPTYKYVFFVRTSHGHDFELFRIPLVGSCSWWQGAYVASPDC